MKVKFIFLTAILTLLFSCYNQTIYLNSDNNSGKMVVEYSFNDNDFSILSLAMMGVSTEEGDDFDPGVLLDEDMLKEKLSESNEEGIKVEEVKVTSKIINDEISLYNGKIVISFKDLDKLVAKYPMGTKNFIYEKKGTNVIVAQKVDMAEFGDAESLDNFVALTKEDNPEWYKKFIKSKFNIEINTKRPIIESKGVKISPDKRKVSYSFILDELLNQKKVLEFMIKL